MINSGELVFIKSVKDGIPNRDPLNDSDARRIFSEEDGRISLSDVSVKRDVRDYVLAKYPDGGAEKNNFVFVREEKTPDGKLLGRKSLADEILKARKDFVNEKGNTEELLKKAAFDVRTFGVVYSVSKENFNLVGPIQFGWAHSLHPALTKYVQGTVVMPSKDLKGVETAKNDSEDSEKTTGTIWTSYTLPFAVFSMPAVLNANIAEKTGMTVEDQELLLEGLWKGTQNRQARGRGNQQPLFLVHVEYNDPFDRIGYLEEYIRLIPDREEWLQEPQPTSVAEIELDVTQLSEILEKNKHKIARCRYWKNPMLKLKGTMFGTEEVF